MSSISVQPKFVICFIQADVVMFSYNDIIKLSKKGNLSFSVGLDAIKEYQINLHM